MTAEKKIIYKTILRYLIHFELNINNNNNNNNTTY